MTPMAELPTLATFLAVIPLPLFGLVVRLVVNWLVVLLLWSVGLSAVLCPVSEPEPTLVVPWRTGGRVVPPPWLPLPPPVWGVGRVVTLTAADVAVLPPPDTASMV